VLLIIWPFIMANGQYPKSGYQTPLQYGRDFYKKAV
jgi:hypothetical protein